MGDFYGTFGGNKEELEARRLREKNEPDMPRTYGNQGGSYKYGGRLTKKII